MNKFDILEQVYPDELEYIFDQGRISEIHRLEGLITQMHAFGSGEGPKKWFEGIAERYNKLIQTGQEEKQPEEDPFERLQKFKKQVDKTKKTRRRGGD